MGYLLSNADVSIHCPVTMTGAVAYVLDRLAPRRLRVLPAALVAIVAATIFAYVMELQIKQIIVPHNLFEDMLWPTATSLSLLTDRSIYFSALAVALIASAESLLCAAAVDRMHHGPRTRYDRELAAQGV
jgi:MFS superfamily sulfate permease-like transporter